jgi:hypothetical protein
MPPCLHYFDFANDKSWYEEFEDIKRVIRIRKSKKDRARKGLTKKGQSTQGLNEKRTRGQTTIYKTLHRKRNFVSIIIPTIYSSHSYLVLYQTHKGHNPMHISIRHKESISIHFNLSFTVYVKIAKIVEMTRRGQFLGGYKSNKL